MGTPLWLVFIELGAVLIAPTIAAVTGPMIVERYKLGRTTPKSPEFALAPGHVIDVIDVMTHMRDAIADLRARVGRLEEMMQMTGTRGRQG